jgi:predicted RNase H-like nuclease
MCAAAVEFQAISFNIANRRERHLHLAMSATDAEFQGILFTIARPLVIPNLTITRSPILLCQKYLHVLLMAFHQLLPQLHL